MKVRLSWMRAFAVLSLVIGTAPMFAQPAAAHNYWDWYPARWSSGGGVIGGNMQFFFTASVPNGAWRDRIRGGVAVWNRPGQLLLWVELPPLGDYNPADVCSFEGRRSIHLGALATLFPGAPAPAVAWTRTCVYVGDAGRLFSMSVTFDTQGVNWSTEPGGPPNNSYTDVQSHAAHEFGHASGHAIHWTDPSMCIQNINIHTMCGVLLNGTTWWRDLYTHDWHTFDAAY